MHVCVRPNVRHRINTVWAVLPSGEPGLQAKAQTRRDIFLGHVTSHELKLHLIRSARGHTLPCQAQTRLRTCDDPRRDRRGLYQAPRKNLPGRPPPERGRSSDQRPINHIVILVAPNDDYCRFENWLNLIQLGTLLEEQKTSGKAWTSSSLIHRLGKEINNEESVYYWAYKVRFGRSSSCLPNFLNRRCCRLAQNVIPVLFPTITDGVIGDVVCMDSFKFRDSGLAVDIARGVRPLDKHSRTSITARMVVIGGGVCKHQIASALMIVSSASDWVLY